MEGKRDKKAERKQSFVRGEEKRKPTHRRTPSGSTTPRKESVPVKEKAPLPKDKKQVSKPIAQSEKLRRKNESNFEKENREKLVQKIAKSVKNEEVKVIGTRIRADSVGDKDKFVLHVEDATVFSTSPKLSDSKQSNDSQAKSGGEKRLKPSSSSERLKEASKESKSKSDVQPIGNLPESPGARRKNWMSNSPPTTPEEGGFYPKRKSDFDEILSDSEQSKQGKKSLPKFPNLPDSQNDPSHFRSDVSPGGYDNLDSPFSSSDFPHYDSKTSTETHSYKQHSYEEEEYDNLHPQSNSASPPFTSKMSKCLSVPSDIQKSLENLTSGSQTDLLSSVTISEISTSVESFSVSQNDEASKAHRQCRRSTSLDSVNDSESPLTRTLKEINAQIDRAFKSETDKAQKLKREQLLQAKSSEKMDFAYQSKSSVQHQSSVESESNVYTDRPASEIQVVETPQLVRKAARPTQISQAKLETNIDNELLIEHRKEVHEEKVHFGLSDDELVNFEKYKAETGNKIDMSEEDFEFFTKQARSNQSSKRHSAASSIASPMSDLSPGEYRRRIVSPTGDVSRPWRNVDKSDGEHTTPTNSPPTAQRPTKGRTPSQEEISLNSRRPNQIRSPSQEELPSPSALPKISKFRTSQEEISHVSSSVHHHKIRTPSQEELYHGSPVSHRPTKIHTQSQENLPHSSPSNNRPNKLRNPQESSASQFVENPIYTGPANTSPKSPPAKLTRNDHGPQRLETAIDETLFKNDSNEGKESAERNFEKLLFKTSQRVDGENAVVQSPRSPRQQPRWEDLAGLNQDFVSVIKKDAQSPKSQKVPKPPLGATSQTSLDSPEDVSFDKKLQDLSNFNEHWRTQLAPTGDVCRLGSHGEKLNEVHISDNKIETERPSIRRLVDRIDLEMERPSIQKLADNINRHYGFHGERTLRRSSTVAAMERLEEYEPRVRQKTPECSTDEQTLTLEKPMIKRCQTESNIPRIKQSTVVTQDTSSNTSSSANSEPTHIEYEPTDHGKVLRTDFTEKFPMVRNNSNQGEVTLPPSYPVMPSGQTSHLVNNETTVPMETDIDGQYLNDQQILSEVLPFGSVIDDIDFNESCFGIPTHQNLSNEMREKIQERLKAEREQANVNIPERTEVIQSPFSNPRSPTQIMEIETHFSADPYQMPVATVHFLTQGPIIHASPQVIEKLDNSEEAAQNAINQDLELSMTQKKRSENNPSMFQAEIVGVSDQVIRPELDNMRNTGLENMTVVTPTEDDQQKLKLNSEIPELAPPRREYIEVYRPILVKRKIPIQTKPGNSLNTSSQVQKPSASVTGAPIIKPLSSPETQVKALLGAQSKPVIETHINGTPPVIPKSSAKPPLHKSNSVDYYKTENIAMESCDDSDDVFVDQNTGKSRSKSDVTVSVMCRPKPSVEFNNMPLSFISEFSSRSSLDDSALEMASSRHEDFMSEEESEVEISQSHQSSKLENLRQMFECDSARSSQVSNSSLHFHHENNERVRQTRLRFANRRSYSQTEQYSSELSDELRRSGSNVYSSQVSGQLWQMPGSRRSISTDLGYEFRPKKIEKVTIGITNFGKPPKHRGSSRGRAASESSMSESEMTIRFSTSRTSPKTVLEGSPKTVRTSPKVLRADENSRGVRSPQNQRNVDLSLRFVRQKPGAGSPKNVRHVSFDESSETTQMTVTSPLSAQSESVITTETTENRMSQSLNIPNGKDKSRKVERRGSIKELMQFFEEKTSKREEKTQEEVSVSSQLRHCPRVRSESPNYCHSESRRNETFRHSLEIPSNSPHLEGLVRPNPVRIGPKPFYGAKQ